jgi:MFS family permease
MSFWIFLGAVVGAVVGVVVAIAIVAAVVATGGIAGVLLGIGLALALSLAVTGVSYLIASNVDPMSGLGQFFRGFMIGFNAGMNGVLAGAIFGPVVGIAIGVINFLAAFDGIAENSVYQGILGWTSWFMPMSWGATGLGLVFFAINLVAAAVTDRESTKIEKLAIDWKTGSIAMVGGWIRNGTAFDMGNFVFLDPNYVGEYKTDAAGQRYYELNETTYKETLAHETGHTISVAAFGTAFGICDLIGENLIGLGAEDYGEKIAESHANRSGRPTIPMWG